MASLDKLAIRGVRSFDDKSINIIQFFTPLTVIVGYNGSGKTTIIECLKYATTGDLPPNTKGGAFVHDPQMATTNEVKAQVRLRFYNAAKVRMNCVRNLQVSKKKGGGLTMKTLEGLLQIADEGAKGNKRGTISTKCSELDEEIPRLLGVSKSILENVIFCHQEDSNWPLAEPAGLKKKFDDIFEATRYTKALDNIKSLRKERTQQLKVDKAALEGLKTDKDRADAIKAKLSNLQADLAEKESKLDDLNEEIRIKTAQNTKFYDEAVKFREIVNRAETLEEKERLHKENMKALESSMTVIDETDSELQRRKESFQNHLQGNRKRAENLTNRISSKEDELHRIQEKHQKKLSEKGGLEAEMRNHEKAIEKREAQIKKISHDLGIKGFNAAGLSESQIHDFSARVQDEAKRLENEYSRLKAEIGRKEGELNAEWQNLRNELSLKKASRESAIESIKRIKDRIARCQDELDSVPITELDVTTAEKERDDTESRVEASRKEFADLQFDEKIKEKNNEIRDKEELREERTADLNVLNRHAELRATLGMKMQEISNRKNSAQSLLDRNSASFKRQVGSDPSADSFETEVNRVICGRERDLASAEKEDQEKNKALQQIESSLTFSRNQLKEKTILGAKLDQEIRELIGSEFDSVDQAQQSADEEISFLKETIGMIEHAGTFFTRVLKTGKEKSICMACNRGISDQEMAVFEKHVLESLKKTQPEQKKQYEADLKDWSDQLVQIQRAATKEAQLKQIRSVDVPAVQRKVSEEEKELAAASKEAEASATATDEIKADIRGLQNLKRVGADITRLLLEAVSFEKEVEMLQNDLAGSGSTQTGVQVQNDIDNLTASIKSLKRDLLALQQDRENKRSLISSLDRDLHRAEMKVVTKRQEYSKRETLQKQLEEFKEELYKSQEDLKRLDDEVEAANAPIRKAKDELELYKSESSKDEELGKSKMDQMKACVSQLGALDEAVNSFITLRGPQRLRDCEDAISDLEAQTQDVQKEIAGIKRNLAEIEKEMNESKTTERNILDNIRYRQLEKDVIAIEKEIDSLDLEQAQRSRKHFADKYADAKEEENQLNGEASHLSGEIVSLKSQIKGRETELREEYKGVHQNYMKKLIEVKTSDLANSDLEKYAKALDNAIMRYHSIKMEEINEQIKYLWNKTYQGTDIDTILIKSDNDSATKGNRSYNYRVCMVKDTVEMDMRGRCSAGQKVLASIIIRLALADSFGNNCGILALDEPTTNLDKENIEALARSLADIIKERRDAAGLQLIVITHDEDFLSLLGQSDALDYYWRVSRDVNQKSIIVRERIRSS